MSVHLIQELSNKSGWSRTRENHGDQFYPFMAFRIAAISIRGERVFSFQRKCSINTLKLSICRACTRVMNIYMRLHKFPHLLRERPSYQTNTESGDKSFLQSSDSKHFEALSNGRLQVKDFFLKSFFFEVHPVRKW